MSWLHDAKLSTKLITSFGLCALITLGVGVLGSRGVSQLSESLKSVFNNNLVSVANTAETKTKAVGQTRDMFRLYIATASNAPQSEKDDYLASMKANQLASEKAFAAYRSTPLAPDERAAGARTQGRSRARRRDGRRTGRPRAVHAAGQRPAAAQRPGQDPRRRGGDEGHHRTESIT